ncbi:MAG: phospholipid/cholesterol/gamma-HCH transport system substrate-binding protein [Pseudonocardiales bacterium]|nr:phospholipid/cholesterol/gamma-HCH transport system substrate-binding protein [Pseudonocardiales bacterium]
MMPRFREFNPLKTAIVGLGITFVLLVGAFEFPKLPLVAGPSYLADFSDGGGMAVGDQVWVAGTLVGKVTDMELAGTKVRVTFTASGVRLGNQTTAAIKTATLLGKRFLGVSPGPGPEMGSGDVIPLERTTSPYNISRSIEDVTAQLQGFDKPKLEAALNSFSDAFQDTPENFKQTFANVKALSETINTRDAALRELLSHANGVSAVLSDRTTQFQSLLIDGNSLLAELQHRQEVINKMFDDFNYVTEQAKQFVKENNDQLGPVLDELNDVLDILKKNNSNLSLAIQRVSSFIGGLGEGVATGPRFTASAYLSTPGLIFNYTDLLRQVNNPQAPRLPSTPGVPGGLGTLPNPLSAPPSGAGANRPNPQPTDPANKPLIPPMGGN